MLGMVKFADALLVLLRLCCFCCLQFRYLPYTSFAFFFFFFFFFFFLNYPFFVSCKGCDPRAPQCKLLVPYQHIPSFLLMTTLIFIARLACQCRHLLSFNMPYLHIPDMGGDSDLYSQAGSSLLPPMSQIV